MIKVIIIGSGNVAQHLIVAFERSKKQGAEIELIQVFSRKVETIIHLVDSNRITTDYNNLLEADLYIIAVSDDAIQTVASQLPFKNRLVVHTSGTAALNVLNEENRKGVFYPLQTFSKNKEVDFKEYINPNSLEIITGYLEPSLASAKDGDRFQFQRLGYYCVDRDSTAEKLVFNKTVGLRDTWAKVESKE